MGALPHVKAAAGPRRRSEGHGCSAGRPARSVAGPSAPTLLGRAGQGTTPGRGSQGDPTGLPHELPAPIPPPQFHASKGEDKTA